MTCLMTASDDAQAWLIKAMDELEAPDRFDGWSAELQQKAEELVQEMRVIHGAVEDLHSLASDELQQKEDN